MPSHSALCEPELHVLISPVTTPPLQVWESRIGSQPGALAAETFLLNT
jgi:hypothetical protein